MCKSYQRFSVLRIPLNAETRQVAARLVWFESPEQALSEPVRFLAYAFAHARAVDMGILRMFCSDSELRYALQHAPPGIIDARSWAYWHVMLDLGDAPELPQRAPP